MCDDATIAPCEWFVVVVRILAFGFHTQTYHAEQWTPTGIHETFIHNVM